MKVRARRLRTTRRPLGSPCGSPRRTWRRCFSPTSATDVRHEHPHTVRLPSSQLALRRPRSLFDRSRGALAALHRLATTQPRLDARLTARAQLSPSTHGSNARLGRSRVPPCGGYHSETDFFGRPRSSCPKSDASCRAPRPLGACPERHEEPEPLPPSSRQGVRLSRLEAPSLDKLLPGTPLSRSARWLGNPPPVSRLEGR
jgi:hypothetical protein